MANYDTITVYEPRNLLPLDGCLFLTYKTLGGLKELPGQ